MKKITNIMNRLVSRKENAEKNENGFSLLELVVAIGILLVLTVGGLIGYATITDNARDAAVSSAASEVSTSVMVKITEDPSIDVKAYVEGFTGTDGYTDMTFTSNDTSPYTITVTHAKGNEATRTITP